MFAMTYLVATKWGSMQEHTRSLRAPNFSEARRQADSFLASLQSKGKAVYPQYDLVQEAS
jgi:hypothetical protein